MTARATAIAKQEDEIEQSRQRAIQSKARQNRPASALAAMAQRLNVSQQGLEDTLTSTVFQGCKSREEFIALVIVANEYGLNPLTKEMYAFPGKGGGIVPMVSVDGWIRIMNEHPAFDGIEFDNIVDQSGKVVAIESVIHRKDRAHPIKTIEYLEECKRNTDPWKLMPNRMLRNRALIQGARIAFGFAGIVGEGDEVEYGSVRAMTDLDYTEAPVTLSDARASGEDQEEEFNRDPATGMSEVDEDVARELDCDSGEVEHEEQSEEDESSPWAQTVEDLIEKIDECKDKAALKKVEAEFLKIRAVLPDDPIARVEGALRTMGTALTNAAKKDGEAAK